MTTNYVGNKNTEMSKDEMLDIMEEHFRNSVIDAVIEKRLQKSRPDAAR